MSVQWNYIDGSTHEEEENQHITFHDEELKTAGEITSHPKAVEKTNSFMQLLKSAVGTLPHQNMYTFADSHKKVHAIVEPASESKKAHKHVLYYKNNKSEKINVYHTARSTPKQYCFEYEDHTYSIQSFEQQKRSIQQIYLDNEVVAATMRDTGKRSVVRFKVEEKFQKDSWLWLSILHSLFTETKNNLPFSTV